MRWFLLPVSLVGIVAGSGVSVALPMPEHVNIKINIEKMPESESVKQNLPAEFLINKKDLLGSWRFNIQKYETSCAEYLKWKKAQAGQEKVSHGEGMGNSADYECSLAEEQPVTRVSWKTASDYCRAHKGRLPTESEWIVAAVISTGNKQRCYPPAKKGDWVSGSNSFVNNREQFLNCVYNNPDEELADELGLDSIEQQKNDVKLTWPGINGVYGMEGNVWEWTSTQWQPQGLPEKQMIYRVIKGGAFTNGAQLFINNPQWRNAVAQDNNKYSNIGFRCVWDSGEQ